MIVLLALLALSALVAVLAGSLFVVSAQNSQGTDLRPGRYTSLADVVAALPATAP